MVINYFRPEGKSNAPGHATDRHSRGVKKPTVVGVGVGVLAETESA